MHFSTKLYVENTKSFGEFLSNFKSDTKLKTLEYICTSL